MYSDLEYIHCEVCGKKLDKEKDDITFCCFCGKDICWNCIGFSSRDGKDVCQPCVDEDPTDWRISKKLDGTWNGF